MNSENENKESLISELSDRLLNGILKENPTFVLLLGMCPTLAVTTSAKNGLGMGVTTMVVLALSNLFISLLRKVIPDKIRIPAFIVIIASFVTMVELLLEAYMTDLYDALGLYIPLIVVNCIILGRAEAYAYSHKPIPSLFDGIGMGMGFTFALTIIGAFRELIGAGTIFSMHVMPKGYIPVNIFIMAPGAFFVLAMLTAIQNKVKEIGEKKGKDMSKIQSGCGGNCMECNLECAHPEKKEEILSNENKDVKEKEIQPDKAIKTNKKVEETVSLNAEKTEDKSLEEKDNKQKKSNKKTSTNITLSELKPIDETPELSISETEIPKAETEKTITSGKKNKSDKMQESVKSEAAKTSENIDSQTPKSVISETVTEEKTKVKENSDDATSEESGLELIDITDSVKANSSVSTPKKPKRKKASLEKAQAMLNKAEETRKEENND